MEHQRRMTVVQKRPWLVVIAAAVMLLLVVVGGYALYLGSAAGVLPWQEEPTRIAITPFAGIPGFGGTATATPAP
jgi:hypothetical protein